MGALHLTKDWTQFENEETLFNLGLPPNRPEGQQGFLVYDTDGR
jgi:hypothetical protein